MKDEDKTKDQLISELKEIRKYVSELNQSKAHRKHTERVSQQCDKKYNTIVESILDIIYTCAPDGTITYINPQASLFGYAPDEVIGRHISEFIHPDDVDSTMNGFQKAIQKGETTPTSFRMIKPDGQYIYVEEINQIIRDGDKIVQMIGTIRDITERKQAEKEKAKLEAQLRRSQKLETIGTLVGGIAHEINNILMPIMGYSDMALSKLPPSDPINENLKEILKEATRAKELVAQILTFSQQSEQERKPLYLHLVVKEALKLLRASFQATIEIRQYIDDSCEKILADPSQMHQVIVNLCSNGFQAIEQTGGTLTIELKQVKIDAAATKFNSNLSEKEYVRLTVSDTGAGMDNVTLDRIFEPFFTTKDVNKGSGMGLSVVHGIIRSHHGDITVSSEQGKGSTFHVYLPVMKTDVEIEPKKIESIQRGQDSILIVDDEEHVASVIKKMLSQLGYKVTVINSSIEALITFRQQPTPYDLLITDLTMPNLTGLDLAKQIHKIRSELPIILMTGYSESVSKEIQTNFGIRYILGKPILMRDLASAIRQVLDK